MTPGRLYLSFSMFLTQKSDRSLVCIKNIEKLGYNIIGPGHEAIICFHKTIIPITVFVLQSVEQQLT